MTIKIEVTGETAEELISNTLRMFGLPQVAQLQQSLPANANPVSLAPPGPAVTDYFPESELPGDTPMTEPLEDPKLSKTPENSASSSDQSGSLKKSAKPPKLEEIKTRLSEVITAAAERGWPKERRNHYARELLRDFGATRVTDIDTDQKRAEFMAHSVRYVSGEHPET